MEPTTAIQTIDFHGDELACIRDPDGRRLWVVVRRVCEALGPDESGQRQKLQKAAWAVTELISATGPDGKRYESFCIELDSLPMWLATIHASRVAPHVRPKLERYQREARDVLAAHFLGGARPGSQIAAVIDPNVEAIIRRTADGITDGIANRVLVPIVERLDRVNTRIESVADDVGEIRREQTLQSQRLEALESIERATEKKRPKDKDREQHAQFVLHVFGGFCPCCPTDKPTRIVLQNGAICGGQMDHYISNCNRKSDAMWLICARCNVRNRNAQHHREVQPLFEAYHFRYARWSGPLFRALN